MPYFVKSRGPAVLRRGPFKTEEAASEKRDELRPDPLYESQEIYVEDEPCKSQDEAKIRPNRDDENPAVEAGPAPVAGDGRRTEVRPPRSRNGAEKESLEGGRDFDFPSSCFKSADAACFALLRDM
jgi:hypothetical protein